MKRLIKQSEEQDRIEFKAIMNKARAMGKLIDCTIPVSDDFTSRVVASAKAIEDTSVKTEFLRTQRNFLKWQFLMRMGGVAALFVVTATLMVWHQLKEVKVGDGSSMQFERSVSSDAGKSNLSTALDRVVAMQNSDGTWSPQSSGGNVIYKPALTALSLLALERHAEGIYDEPKKRAVEALTKMQMSDGSFGGDDYSKLYNHALACYALLEYEARRGGEISKTLLSALAFIERNQNEYGAWDYAMHGEGNSAVTLWQAGILAKAHKLGYADNSGTMRRAIRWLDGACREGSLDYRIELDKRRSFSGGIVLTQMATKAVGSIAVGNDRVKYLSDNLQGAFDFAYGRYAFYDLHGDSALDYNEDKVFASLAQEKQLYPILIGLLSLK